jgi:hypothetical protein
MDNIGGSVVSFSPELDNSAHNPCLNVVVQDLSANPTSLEDFTKISIDQIRQMLPHIDEVHLIDRSLGGCEGKHVEYLTTLQGTQLKFLQVFTLKENTAYIITFSAPVSSHLHYSKIIEHCLESFQIIKRRGTTSLSLIPYYNPQFSYTLRYPRSWTREELQGGSVVKFEFLEDGNAVVTFFVAVKKVGDLDLDEYSVLLQEQVRETCTPNSQPTISPSTLGGFQARKTTFYSDSLQVTGRYNIVWTVLNKHVGTLSFVHTLPEDDPEQNLYYVMFERIVDSFRFTSPKEAVDETVRYENIPQKFAIHYPNSYIQQEGFMGSTVSFSHPADPAANEFPTNLNVVVQDMGNQPMTLDEFCDMLKQQLEMSVRNCQMVTVTDMNIAGGAC